MNAKERRLAKRKEKRDRAAATARAFEEQDALWCTLQKQQTAPQLLFTEDEKAAARVLAERLAELQQQTAPQPQKAQNGLYREWVGFTAPLDCSFEEMQRLSTGAWRNARK
jgi:hypothetical protein